MGFEKVKRNFGFGCMRLQMKDGKVDYDEFCKMIDAFMEAGFNYFDTAKGYISGMSETALRDCLAARYPRESYVLVNKLSGGYFHSEADIRPLFEEQLASCGVDYFDIYLMHAQNAKNFEEYKAWRAYETAFALKAEGKVRHVGISFHDKAEVLDRILTEYPEIEVVQIQFNYLDYENPGVEGRLCYEVCRKHGKPIIVMEPVRGGALVNLPLAAKSILESLGGGSAASYAIRYAAGFEGVMMVLSGMGNMEMMQDNISYMQDFKPLTKREHEAVMAVTRVLNRQDMIACTACRYCVDGCPMGIAIPDLFACRNGKRAWQDFDAAHYYALCTKDGGSPSDCIGCGACEEICPQHLPIRGLLAEIAKEPELSAT